MGCFFGFKLHLPINHHGQIMAVKITGGNTTDGRQPLPLLYGGKVVGDGDTLPSSS